MRKAKLLPPRRVTLAAAALSCLIHPVHSLAGSNSVTSADDLVAHHLQSIGDAKARADCKTRVAQGTAQFKILVGGSGILDGKSVLVSDGSKLHFIMKFPNNEYRGEQFISNGNKIEVSSATAQQARSGMGGFVYLQDAVLREGLWGGTLSTAWPLLDLNARKAHLSLDGIKKVDGEDLYELRYRPKKNTDLEIYLYFDPETYHHVLTLYKLSIQSGLGHVTEPSTGGSPTPGTLDNPMGSGGGGTTNETASARQQQIRYRLEERFADFKAVDGLTLPTRYVIHFTQEQQSGRTTVSEWTVQESDIGNNKPLDPRNFDIK